MDNKLITSRANFEKPGTDYKQANNDTIDKEIIESIPYYWFYKDELRYRNKIIYCLHGGSIALGSFHSPIHIYGNKTLNLAARDITLMPLTRK